MRRQRCPPPDVSASKISPGSTICLLPARVSNSRRPLSVITYWRCGALCQSRLAPAAVSSKVMVWAGSGRDIVPRAVASFHLISPTWKCDWPSSPVKRRMSLIATLTFPRFVEPPAPQGLEFPAHLYALQALVYRLAQCGVRAGERDA